MDGLLVRMTPPLGVGAASGVLGLKMLQGQGKRDRTGAGTGLGRPAQAQFGPVRSPLLLRGSSCTYVLCPLHLHDFDAVILASKMEALFA